RVGGDFEKVLELMRIFVEERNALGREVPFINWRYIIFKWNDSKPMMKKVKKLAAKIGVDRFCWEITDHPPEAKSEKYQIGTPEWKEIYHEIWDTSQIGNALKKKRFTARMKPAAGEITVKAGEESEVKVKVKNTGGGLWLKAAWSGRRWVRLGAQLHDADKKMIDLNYARAFLNGDIGYKKKDTLAISLPAVAEPGDYYLKFDMVSEGNEWFENGGSPVVWVPLQVRPA
ncbi:MAG: hypothetical protein GY765_14580, partial [bacterium]|nr:hypothetical protein [bacterium]